MKSILVKMAAVCSFAVVLAALPAPAALNMFMNINGIPGESTDPAHTNQVDVLAWSWGMSQSGNFLTSGKVNIQDLSFTKYVDKASPLLMSRCASGTHITTATLYVLRAGATPNDYVKIILTDVVVTSVSTGGSGGDDKLTENISLNFAKVEFDYSVVANGKASVPNPFIWDSSKIISP